MTGFREHLAQRRELIGKFLFEIVIIFVGVTAAFALEAARQDRQDTEYRRSMVVALAPTLDDVIRHNQLFEAVDRKLTAFDTALARGEQPGLPIYREAGSERPPTRVWDGLVSAGASSALDPKLLYDLALLYTRLDSFGEKYVRYNDFTEQKVFSLGAGEPGIYDPETGHLKPEYVAYVDRLRDLRNFAKELDAQAAGLKERLKAQR